MRTARYNRTPIGRGLERLDLAIDALNTLHRETTEVFPAHAEIHLDDIATHITAIRAKLTRAKLALDKLNPDESVVTVVRKFVPGEPASHTVDVLASDVRPAARETV